MKKVLVVHYGPGPKSYTQKSVAYVVENFKQKGLTVIEQDLAASLPSLYSPKQMAAYVNRNFLKESISEDESKLLEQYDSYAQELVSADALVIAFPVYNFSIPAAIKAWIDAVAQPRQTFKYGMYGPEGLLKAKKALVLMSSGSTRISSSRDFATPYIEHVLKFMGIKEVLTSGVTGTRLTQDRQKQMSDFKVQLEELLQDFP